MLNLQNTSESEVIISQNLKTILATSERLKEIKSNDIKFSQPILVQGENAVIFPHTINAIQGQAGVHKSRLAEIICAAFMNLHNNNNDLLGFKRTNFDANQTVVYVDTERNLAEQLPYALQSIQIKAGYEKADNPTNFKYISLLQIKRQQRFEALNDYLNYIKHKTNDPVFIVLDVATDCIEDFNRTDESMKLIDLMNVAVNEHNVTFLCLIHENPKSDKARGHFGTELMNKSSTLMQIGFEKDGSGNETDLIRVKYLKCRSTAKHTPFFIKYCQEAKGLVLANAQEISSSAASRQQKATREELIEHLEMYLGDGSQLSRIELLKKLNTDLGASDKTIEGRLKELLNSAAQLTNESGKPCLLFKVRLEKVIYYKLKPIENN